MSELRYHPFLQQWVITATHRQDRTFLPPADFNPLAPTQPGGFPTEIPFPEYDIVVFENKFPSLQTPAPKPAILPTPLIPISNAEGVCEVICYSSDATATFATLPFSQIRKLARVWKERYLDLSQRKEVQYVFIFENKGKEIGVTLTHPHGQIYGYPFIPPIPKIELGAEKAHFELTGRRLMADLLAEIKSSELVVWENDGFVAFVPPFARYPFEVYVVPKQWRASLADMDESELDQLSEALLIVAKKYDKLFEISMPYIMAMHQRPCVKGGNQSYDETWFHVEFYPPYRTANKLKYLAGSEAGAGAFINDTLPEESAGKLRELEVELS